MRRRCFEFHGSILILAAGVLCAVTALGVPPPPVLLHDYVSTAGHLRLVAASAHAPGLEGTSWVTDLEIHNPGETAASGFLFLLKTGEDNSDAVGRYFGVNAGASVRLSDVVLGTFGEFEATGGILVGSDAELIVTSRTFNDDQSGTYGQYVEGYADTDALATADEARLIQLVQNAAFRTNLGVVNAGGTGFWANVDFYRSNGDKLGSKRYWVGPFTHIQRVKVLTTVTDGDVDDGYAVVETSTTGARFFVYASVNDNRTGDATMIVPAAVSAGTAVYLPGAACVSGYEDTAWRTDLEVHNPGGSQAHFTVELLARDEENTAPEQRSFSLGGGLSVRYVDVIASVFGTDGAATLRITPTQGQISAIQRTYNNQPAGTYGQFVAGMPENAAVAYGEEARIVQLSQSSSDTDGFRANLGLVNASGAPITVNAEFYRADGVRIGSRSYWLPAHGYRQENKVFRKVTTDAVYDGYVVLSTTTAAGRFFAYASVVDNRSGDPITIPARVCFTPCSYAIDPTSRSHGAGEETGSFTVAAPGGCDWRASPSASWIRITQDSGSGNGTVSYRLEANPEPSPRTGTIEVPGAPMVGVAAKGVVGETFTITQAGQACTYALDPTSYSHGAGEETGSFMVTAPAGCAWTAYPSASWIQLTDGGSGSGNGVVSYRVEANTGADRSRSIVVHGVAFTVTQEGAAEITVMLPDSVPLKMVRVPAGTFQMGSPETEQNRDAGPFAKDETLHTVTLTKDYYLGKTEVTQRQWRAVMGASPPSECWVLHEDNGVGDNHPAYCVSWTDICGGTTGSDCAPASFIGKLNAYLGSTKYRLPTEAEWERAARAETATRFSHGDVLECGDFQCDVCSAHEAYMWWCGDASDRSHPVGQKAPNPWGLQDIHGNVVEWVADWYAPYPSSAVTDPTGPATGPGRVGRGGSWADIPQRCRSAMRDYGPPDSQFHIVGFRLARSP